MKHTQGKWKVMHSTSPEGECALAVWPDTTIEGSIGSPICKVSPIENVNETDEANAILIANAPELLQALTDLVAAVKPLVHKLGVKKGYHEMVALAYAQKIIHQTQEHEPTTTP